MKTARHIRRDELAGDPGRVLRAVRQGETIVVEEHGQPQAVIVDPVDLEILKAVICYYVNRPQIDRGQGLEGSKLLGLSGTARTETALAYYLSGAISLSRAAEVLGTSWLDLRGRFSRLGLPLRDAPIDREGAKQDLLIAESTLS
ncbi:MAG: hypothetical protein GY719_34560 [bacterium]|nr:hypothetical protein [bacterium]